jgi:hypothetical protein
MKIELKRFTTSARLSQETTAFAADVWVDGKKAGTAQNDGRGGATIVRLDPSVRDLVEARGKTLVPDEIKGYTTGAEWIVDQLVEAELRKRDAKSLARRLTKGDAKEKGACAKRGLLTARLRSGDTWLWFAYRPGSDPAAIAARVATQEKLKVDELVVLS